MNRLATSLEQANRKKRKLFVAYITAGDPDLNQTLHYCRLLESAGVDVIELGVPYSDPLADGPTNQAAAQRALAHGTSLNGIFETVAKARQAGIKVPIILFSYVNPLLKMGWEHCIIKSQANGIDGFLIVDLPPEEAGDYVDRLEKSGLSSVFLIAPTTKPERYALISEQSSGFVYYVSRTGVTGAQNNLPSSLLPEIRSLKRVISKPLVVGFGISNAQQAAEIAAEADGIVIGSAIVNYINEIQAGRASDNDLMHFVRSIRQNIDQS